MNFSRLLFLPVQFEQHHHFQVLLSQLGEVLGLKGTSKSSSDSFGPMLFFGKPLSSHGEFFSQKLSFGFNPGSKGGCHTWGGFAILNFDESIPFLLIHRRCHKFQGSGKVWHVLPDSFDMIFSAIIKVSGQTCFRTLYGSLGQIRQLQKVTWKVPPRFQQGLLELGYSLGLAVLSQNVLSCLQIFRDASNNINVSFVQ